MSLAEEYGFNFAAESCERAPFSRFPCRKCLPCLHRRQQEWVSRLCEELRQHDDNYFVTLTYADEYLPYDDKGQMCFDKDRIIKLNRDLRKRFQQGYFTNPVYDVLHGSPKKIELPEGVHFSFYLTSEYGPHDSHRPHYHAVYFNLGVDLYTAELLFRTLWPDGFITIFPAEEGSAGYISKYLCKDVLEVDSYHDDNRQSPIALMSKGLGISYVERMKSFHQADVENRRFFQYHGEKKVLSRYYKNKIYSDDQRQQYLQKIGPEIGLLRDKYTQFKEDFPELWTQLLSERKHFFDEMRERERWNMLKKNKL